MPALGVVAVACGVWSCNTSSSTALTPITGVEIRSGALTAGLGCGTGPGQVYRYAAVVSYSPDAGSFDADAGTQWNNVFDCFADGVFENLPASATGSVSFDVAIYAYNQEAYQQGVAAGVLPNTLGCPPNTAPDICTQATLALSGTAKSLATWTTTCVATQQSGAPVFAVCLPLDRTDASDFAPPEAGSGSPDAAPDAAAPDATVPPDAAPDGEAPQDAEPDASDAGADADAG